MGGSGGNVDHLLLDGLGRKIGGFANDESAIRAMPQQRLLKPAQLVEVPGAANHVFLEWMHPTGTAFIFGAGTRRCVRGAFGRVRGLQGGCRRRP